jgi:acetyl esterase/lipase
MNKIVTFFLLFLGMHISAQSDSLYLWLHAVPGESKPKSKPVQSILEDGSVRVVDVTNPFLAVFEPKEYKRNGKAIIVVPGGGYVRLAAMKEGHAAAQWLNDLGYTAFVLEYRVPNKREGALQDMQRGIKLIKSNAKKYRIDPNKVCAMGFSAGAHLVALAGMGDETQTYPYQDKADSLSSRPHRMIIIYPGYLDGGPDRSLSPNLTANAQTVPTFIYQSMDDNGAQNSFTLAQALRKAGASVELHMYPNGGHGYGMYPGTKAAELWPILLEIWLRDFL